MENFGLFRLRQNRRMSNLDYSDFGESAEWSKTHFFQFGRNDKAQKMLFLISAKVPSVNFCSAVCFFKKMDLLKMCLLL